MCNKAGTPHEGEKDSKEVLKEKWLGAIYCVEMELTISNVLKWTYTSNMQFMVN